MIRAVLMGIVGLGVLLVGIVGAIPRAQAELAQGRGKCDYAACVGSHASAELVFFIIIALLGVSILLVTVRQARASVKRKRIMQFRVKD